ncbi:MAG TPA: aminotransferase class V-fold PLP-dependent enzyme [Casimicrobiaceae bacterium]|nr:aminotransferase class V-fold PLP-dependent enzyme [Casimicrobiaceae bacterium]
MNGFGRALRAEWALDPAGTYLNHGTVGATPRRVLAAQQAIRDEIQRHPARYLLRELADVKQIAMRARPRMRVAADAVAAFLGARGEDLVFVDNATAGVNAVLRSLRLEPGDEILLTDHGYGSVGHVARHVAGLAGARVVTAPLPWPRWEPEAIVEAVAGALGPRTRLAVVDQVTSPTGLLLPVAAIAARCRAAGVLVLVDGAHGPGALDFAIPDLGGDWYTGNLHKWAMAPISAAVLWARPERQRDLHPPAISWGYGLDFAAEFDLQGTRDPSAWLAAPEGLAFMRDLGLEAMRAWNHRLAWEAARGLADRWGVELPQDESQVGCMAAVPLPARFGTTAADGHGLKDALLYEDGIEAQVHAFRDRLFWRLSAQVYNEPEDFERAARAIERRAG